MIQNPGKKAVKFFHVRFVVNVDTEVGSITKILLPESAGLWHLLMLMRCWLLRNSRCGKLWEWLFDGMVVLVSRSDGGDIEGVIVKMGPVLRVRRSVELLFDGLLAITRVHVEPGTSTL